MLDNEALKTEIEQKLGISKALLIGNTPEENIARARAIIAYGKETESAKPKSDKEVFSDWLRSKTGEAVVDKWDAMTTTLNELEVATRSFPAIRDGGEVTNMPDMRTTQEQFSEWLGKNTAYDPRRKEGGWI